MRGPWPTSSPPRKPKLPLPPHATEIALNLALAWLAGSLIGLERSHNGRAAGFRTHALVALASAGVMDIALEPELIVGAFAGPALRPDPRASSRG